MEEAIQKFIKYLHKTKKASVNTELSYHRDLEKLADYLSEDLEIDSWGAVTSTDLNSYMLYMEEQNYAASSISRSVASIRAFFNYLEKKHLIDDNPSDDLKAPRVEKKMPDTLTIREVDRLLAQPNPVTGKGMRDRAMMELLYELHHMYGPDERESCTVRKCCQNCSQYLYFRSKEHVSRSGEE